LTEGERIHEKYFKLVGLSLYQDHGSNHETLGFCEHGSDGSPGLSVYRGAVHLTGADTVGLDAGNDAPRPLRYLVLMGVSSVTFWVSFWEVTLGLNIVLDTIRKFVCYLSVIVWLNSAYYLSETARDQDVESWEFQKKQVRLTLWIVGVVIVSELPVWIASLSLH
jgi:hypothetical protein